MSSNTQGFLEKYDSSEFEKPSVTADVLLFALDSVKNKNPRLMILVARRKLEPFKGEWALPGSFVGIDETIDSAAARTIAEKVKLPKSIKNIYMEQLYTFGAIDRDPRMRIISTAYIAMIPEMVEFNNEDLMWIDVHDYVNGKLNLELMFDHREIIETAINRLVGKLDYTPIAFGLLEKEFSLLDAQKSYQAILNKKVHKSNFRRDVQHLVVSVGKTRTGDRGPAPELFKLKKKLKNI